MEELQQYGGRNGPRALPYVERVSAFLLITAGTYIVYYWLFIGRLIDTFV